MNNEAPDARAMFWLSKGITDVSTLSVEELRAFIPEMKAFIDGFNTCLELLTNKQ